MVTIVGGGIVGLSSAYYLNRAGHEVTVIDQGDFQRGCSFGNAGMVVPSHFIPMAAPGMVAKGIRWMFDPASPFYVKPRLRADLLKWGYQFYRHATDGCVQAAIPALKQISLLSRTSYRQLAAELPFDFGFTEKGLLMLVKSSHALREESAVADIANRIGIEARVLSATAVQEMEPDVRVHVLGGVYYPGDAHLIPQKLVSGLAAHLATRGVKLIGNSTVTKFRTEAGRIRSAMTNQETWESDEWVLAAGAWSGLLARGLDLTLPVQPGKGYSHTIADVARNIRIPSIFVEDRVAVTPMGSSLRFGGTMELSGFDATVDMRRVEGIANAIRRYYPDLPLSEWHREDIWFGFRPCSPDGLPYIGRSKRFANLTVATAHAMMGVSLAPATGQLVAALIAGQTPAMDLAPFDPDRYQ